jgi:hypothetical protein
LKESIKERCFSLFPILSLLDTVWKWSQQSHRQHPFPPDWNRRETNRRECAKVIVRIPRMQRDSKSKNLGIRHSTSSLYRTSKSDSRETRKRFILLSRPGAGADWDFEWVSKLCQGRGSGEIDVVVRKNSEILEWKIERKSVPIHTDSLVKEIDWFPAKEKWP